MTNDQKQKTEKPSYRKKIVNKIKRRNLFDYNYEKPGSAPGTLNISLDTIALKIVLIDYNSDRANLIRDLTPEACAEYFTTESVSLFNIGGLRNEDFWQSISLAFFGTRRY